MLANRVKLQNLICIIDAIMILYNSLSGLLAQLVEQLTLNQRVEGSSPSRPTTSLPLHWCVGVFGVIVMFFGNGSTTRHFS